MIIFQRTTVTGMTASPYWVMNVYPACIVQGATTCTIFLGDSILVIPTTNCKRENCLRDYGP